LLGKKDYVVVVVVVVMVKIHNAAEKCKIHYVAENDTCGMIDLLGISSS